MPVPLQRYLSSDTLGLGPWPDGVGCVLRSARPITLVAGQPLLRAGEPWRSLYWIEHGVLRLYYLDRRGQSSNKNFYLDGAMFWPITEGLARRPVDFWIEAIGHARVWALPWDDWQAACLGWPAWQALQQRSLAALLDEKMAREQQFLQRTAADRYQDLCARRPAWVERIALRHLASYLGVTDVALSRIRRRLNRG